MTQIEEETFEQVNELNMKSLFYVGQCDPLGEQFQICIRRLESDQSANSQVNQAIIFGNFGTSMPNFAQILKKKKNCIRDI